MVSKYNDEQRVKIKEVRNPDGSLRYHRTEDYLNETGTIIECKLVTSIKDVPGYEERTPIDVYCYRVRLDKDDVEFLLGEEALVVLDK